MIWALRGLLTAFAFTATLAGVGCSNGDSGPPITGNWEAEDLRIDSLMVPIGPRLEISQTEVVIPALETRLPIVAIERPSRDEVTLRFPLLGWTVYFDSADRIHMDVPLMGRVYYRRVDQGGGASPSPALSGTPSLSRNLPQALDTSSGASEVLKDLVGSKSPPTHTSSAAKADLVAELELVPASMARGEFDTAEASISAARVAGTSDSEIALERVCLALLRGDPDTALRSLSEALQSGLLKWSAVEREPRLAPLAQDVRFQALLARHR